jgi:hypothetical protein
MRNARYIGRIGASAAVLGIGATATGGDHNEAFVTGDDSSASATATSAPPPVSPATPARPPRGQLDIWLAQETGHSGTKRQLDVRPHDSPLFRDAKIRSSRGPQLFNHALANRYAILAQPSKWQVS